LFWPSTASLIERWENDATGSYDHGYLMVALVAWLFWRNQDLLARADVRFSPRAVGARLGACLRWLALQRAGLQILQQPVLPIIVWLAVADLFGLRAWRLGLDILYL